MTKKYVSKELSHSKEGKKKKTKQANSQKTNQKTRKRRVIISCIFNDPYMLLLRHTMLRIGITISTPMFAVLNDSNRLFKKFNEDRYTQTQKTVSKFLSQSSLVHKRFLAFELIMARINFEKLRVQYLERLHFCDLNAIATDISFLTLQLFLWNFLFFLLLIGRRINLRK